MSGELSPESGPAPENHCNKPLDVNLQLDDDDDEEGVLFRRPVIITDRSRIGTFKNSAVKQEAPAPDFRWNNNAILECFQVSVKSHDESMEIDSNDHRIESSSWYWIPVKEMSENNTADQPQDPPLKQQQQQQSINAAALKQSKNDLLDWKPSELKLPKLNPGTGT